MFWRGWTVLVAIALAASSGCSTAVEPSRESVGSQRSAVGMPAEECSGPAYLVKQIFPPDPEDPSGSGGPRPFDLVAAGGKLYFRAQGSLWVSNGTEAGTFPLRGDTARQPLDVNGHVFFFDQDELYRTNGTPGGTVLVESYARPGVTFNGKQFTGNGLYYFALTGDRGGDGLFRSDGTPEGTRLVASFEILDDTAAALGGHTYFMASREFQDLNRLMLWRTDGETVELVSELGGGARADYLTQVGSSLFFVTSGPSGLSLWKSDGTGAGTVVVKSFGADAGWSSFNTLREVDGQLLFAVQRMGGVELWRSDGTAAGTVPVRVFPSPSPGTPLRELTIVSPEVTRNMYLFFLLDNDGGPAPLSMQLWRSDGTAAGTFALTSANMGEEGGVPTMMAVSGTALFGWQEPAGTTPDRQHGKELWNTDGTVEGTELLQDIRPGRLGSWPSAFTLAGGRVFFVARTDTQGFGLWAVPVTCLKTYGTPPKPPSPPTPPVPPSSGGLQCPADVIAEATGPDGAQVGYAPAVAAEGSPMEYSQESGGQFPLGTTRVTVTSTNASGQRASCSFDVTVRDTTAPRLYCPPNLGLHAWRKDGMVVDYGGVGVADEVSTPEVQYSIETGAFLPLGIHQVVATATDDAGNTGSCSFVVEVEHISCSAGPGSAPWWLLAVLTPLLLRLRVSRVLVRRQ